MLAEGLPHPHARPERRRARRRTTAISCGRIPRTTPSRERSTARARAPRREQRQAERGVAEPHLAARLDQRAGQEVHRRVSDQPRDLHRLRAAVDLLGRADLRDAPSDQHGDAVGHRERVDGFRRRPDGRRLGPNSRRRIAPRSVCAELRVEMGERLVEQIGARRLDQRAAERDALALTSRQLGRAAGPPAPRAPPGGAPRRTRSDSAFADRRGAPGARRGKATLSNTVRLRIERVRLEHEGHPAALGATAVTARPSISTSPADGASSPLTTRHSVDFPAPPSCGRPSPPTPTATRSPRPTRPATR